MESTETLIKILGANKKGVATGVYSVCSAHKTCLEASMLQAKENDSLLLVESTSNQVNQFGGYTGMTATDFAAYIKDIAMAQAFPFERIVLGGDHLGPNAWQYEKTESAMEKAEVLVKSCVNAGYKKIHLDTCMFCLDDYRTKPLAYEIIAERTARLCKACEDSSNEIGTKEGQGKPLYIIGTEVPVPGGTGGETRPQEASEKENVITPTSPENIKETILTMERAFRKAGLESAWERVIAVVAQPGVEFGEDSIFYYDREKALSLSRVLDNSPLVYEAHSTDYQTGQNLKHLVEDHFCILKVGPSLTYAYREALFSLAKIEKELAFKIASLSNLEETIEKVMLESRPNYWEKYYYGTEEEKHFARKFSLSDRVRYYWPNEELVAAVEKLFGNLSSVGIPQILLRQYMPHLLLPLHDDMIGKSPNELVTAHIRRTLELYAIACGHVDDQS
ncbi:MAG: class II D-tagatose-bisphosphate aldolase, non-catalytic subunit [Treponema sp.]|jgi:D-tagatose-1,6-bisphosphate aldolase subunit GatZ/KbaZ|nr:class II D-tagatose-bisphosphate aldolase, non-catalytic subunit [Treponema sp.]